MVCPARGLQARQTDTLGADHDVVLYTAATLGQALCALGRHADADAVLRNAHARQARSLGAEHPETIRTASALGQALIRRGAQPGTAPGTVDGGTEEGRKILEEAHAQQLRQLGPGHAETRRTAARLQQDTKTNL